jgi:hypothetical protein
MIFAYKKHFDFNPASFAHVESAKFHSISHLMSLMLQTNGFFMLRRHVKFKSSSISSAAILSNHIEKFIGL